jgi:hypothetical protein
MSSHVNVLEHSKILEGALMKVAEKYHQKIATEWESPIVRVSAPPDYFLAFSHSRSFSTHLRCSIRAVHSGLQLDVFPRPNTPHPTLQS